MKKGIGSSQSRWRESQDLKMHLAESTLKPPQEEVRGSLRWRMGVDNHRSTGLAAVDDAKRINRHSFHWRRESSSIGWFFSSSITSCNYLPRVKRYFLKLSVDEEAQLKCAKSIWIDSYRDMGV